MNLSSLFFAILISFFTSNLMAQTDLNKLSAVAFSTQNATSAITDHVYTESAASSLKQIKELVSYKFNYPADMRMYGVEGISTVSFEISKEGRIKNLVILKSLGNAFDYEIKQVFRALKNIDPIEVNGKVIAQKIVLPIQFEL